MSAVIALLRRIPREPRLRRRTLVVVLVAALSFVPMAGALGYFSSLILSPLLSLLAATAAVDAVLDLHASHTSASTRSEHDPHPMWRLVRDGLGELAWLLGLSLGVLTLGVLWTINCDPLGGAAFFVMGPVCSASIAWVAGLAMSLLIGPRRRGLMVLAAWLPFALSLAIGVHRLYFEPAVFAFDPFFGWFSGPIYDEGIAISGRYYRYRAYNFTGCAALLLGLRASLGPVSEADPARGYGLRARRMLEGGPNRLRSALALVLALAAISVGAASTSYGFTATGESLAERLGGRVETEHFEIHYGATSLTAREIEMVAAEHEFAWAQLEGRLGRAPERKVESFIFSTGDQRGKMIGANRVEVSPPWRQQMYLSHRSWPHEVMHHELAHAFLGDVGDRLLGLPISGGRFSGALVEGVPTALAPRARDNLGLHEQAAILDRLDKRPPLAQIMGAGFWGAAASRAYTASGSFVLWLAQNHGWEKVAALYANAGDFEQTYALPLAELEAGWLADLRALELRERDIEAQAQRFMRGSVFRRPCAHRAASLSSLAARARLRGQVDEALEAQETLCEIEPQEPGHFLRKAEMLAGWDRFADADTILDELAGREGLTASIRARVEEQRGDTALLAGELAEAERHYAAAMEFGLGEARRRQLEIKRLAAADAELAPLVAAYFSPFRIDGSTRAAAMLRLWTAAQIADLPAHSALGNYLLGRQFLIIAAPDQAAQVLAAGFEDHPEQLASWSPALVRAAYLSRLSALTQLRDWDGARALLPPLEALAEGQGHQAVIDQWRQRLAFFEGYFGS